MKIDEKYVEEKAKELVALMYRLTQAEPSLTQNRINHTIVEGVITKIISEVRAK